MHGKQHGRILNDIAKKDKREERFSRIEKQAKIKKEAKRVERFIAKQQG